MFVTAVSVQHQNQSTWTNKPWLKDTGIRDTFNNKMQLFWQSTWACVSDLINGVIIQRPVLTEVYGEQQHNGPMHSFDSIYNRSHPLVQQVQHVFWSSQDTTIGPLMFSGNDWDGKHILIKHKDLWTRTHFFSNSVSTSQNMEIYLCIIHAFLWLFQDFLHFSCSFLEFQESKADSYPQYLLKCVKVSVPFSCCSILKKILIISGLAATAEEAKICFFWDFVIIIRMVSILPNWGSSSSSSRSLQYILLEQSRACLIFGNRHDLLLAVLWPFNDAYDMIRCPIIPHSALWLQRWFLIFRTASQNLGQLNWSFVTVLVRWKAHIL